MDFESWMHNQNYTLPEEGLSQELIDAVNLELGPSSVESFEPVIPVVFCQTCGVGPLRTAGEFEFFRDHIICHLCYADDDILIRLCQNRKFNRELDKVGTLSEEERRKVKEELHNHCFRLQCLQ